jgi:hypothetical protein
MFLLVCFRKNAYEVSIICVLEENTINAFAKLGFAELRDKLKS